LTNDAIDSSGAGGGYLTGLRNLADGLDVAVDAVPLIGDAVGVQDTMEAYNRGDMVDTGVNVLATALGVVPVLGDVAGKGVKKVVSSLRDSDGAFKAIGNTPFPNAPKMANIEGIGRVRFGPNPEIEAAARDSAARSGIPYNPIERYMPLNEEISLMSAREYDRMIHNPADFDTQRSYEALVREMYPQYEAAIAAGYQPYFIGDVNPYSNSPYEGLIDLAENKRLGVFPTDSGFGSNPNFDPEGNPLLRQSGYNIDGKPALNNDIFRFVHDVYGHGKGGVGFRAMGEENAYQSHAGMFSPLARRALASETRGQNSRLNFGPDGEANRIAKVEDTIFEDQKTGLMPRYASESGLIINDDKRAMFFDDLRAGRTGLEGAITDDGKLRLIHRSNQPLERIDPEKYGSGLSGRTRAEQNRSRGNPEFVKRSFYGIPASENAYKGELGIGSVKNEIEVEPELMYDIRKDPDKIWVPNDPTGSERRISESGYTGFYVDNERIGKVAAIFDPYDTTKTYMIPLTAGVGATGAVVSSLRDEEEAPI